MSTSTTTIPNPRFPKLAEPMQLGAIKCRNRTVMASLTRNRSGTDEGDSVPNADNIEHYRQRAAGGIGLILSGQWGSLRSALN
jgi:2,4-dienoyl-CoA reductase-like NADH-dependent reductase (Old Yellow Enzyme family)